MLGTDLMAHAPRRLMRFVALAVLVGASSCVAHQATYLLAPAGSDGLASTATGHDGRWAPLIIFCLATAALLLGIALRQMRRLAAHPKHAHVMGTADTFAQRVIGLWVGVGASTAVVYAGQEYLERAMAGSAPSVPDLLLAHGLVPIIAIVLSSLLVAVVATLVRWHCELLAAVRRADAGRSTSHGSRPLCPTSAIRPPDQSGLRARGIRAPPAPVAI